MDLIRRSNSVWRLEPSFARIWRGAKMVLLQGLYGQSLGFDRTHCPDACFNPTDCGEDRNTALDSGASNFDFVLSWSLAARRIDDEINLVVLNHVDDVGRPSALSPL